MSVQGNDALTSQLIKSKIRNIRPLPIAVQKLYALVGDLNSKIQDVSQTIEADEMLSAKILQIANSSFYGFSNHVASIPQAVAVIGFQNIRSLALSISVMQMNSGGGPKQHREAIWKESFMVASAARMIGKHLNLKSPEEAFAAGILHNIGQLLLLQTFSAQYASLLTQAQQNPRAVVELEKKHFQMDHAQIGAMICQHWKLPKTMIRATAEHNKPLDDAFPFSEEGSLSYILRRATRLVHTMYETDPDLLDRQLQALGRPWANKTAITNIFNRLPEEMKNIEAFLKQ